MSSSKGTSVLRSARAVTWHGLEPMGLPHTYMLDGQGADRRDLQCMHVRRGDNLPGLKPEDEQHFAKLMDEVDEEARARPGGAARAKSS